MHARKIHIIAGLLTFLLFLFTGYYLDLHVSDLYNQDRWRFSLRGNHIYILMSALLNLSLGSYLRVSAIRWRAALQLVGSLLILTATALLVLAFFRESKAGLDRPVTLWAMISGLTGTVFHLISVVKERPP